MLLKPGTTKSKTEKSSELHSIHTLYKSLSECTAVLLRNKLETRYPELWGNTGNDHRSDEKRIKRALDKLVDFGIATKEKIGKDQVYTYIHDDNKLGKVHKIANELNVSFDDIDTYYKRRNSIISLLNDVSDMYYIQTQQEDISRKENIIKNLELAIEQQYNVEIIHCGNTYNVSPLKIAQFDGYWYLIAYNTKYFTYRIKDISSLHVIQEIYDKAIIKDLNLDKWHNIWHSPNRELTKVKILIDNSVFHYFEEKNILGVNIYKNRLTPCNDGMEYEVYISHEWELLPTLMQWQKHVTLLEQKGKINFIKIYKTILDNIIKKLPS